MIRTDHKILSILLKIFILIWILSIPLKNSFYQISTVAIIVIFCVESYLTRSYNILNAIFTTYKDIFISFGFIILAMTVSNTLGVHAEKAWYIEMMFILRYGILFYILIYFYSKSYISQKLILVMILASISLQGIDGLYQHFFGYDFIYGQQSPNGAWLTGAMFYYNPFGMLMAIGSGLTLSLLIYSKKFELSRTTMYLLGLFFCIFSYDLLYSLSRASWVSFFSLLICLFIINYKKLNIKMILILLFICIAGTFFIINDHAISVRIHQLFQGDSSNRYDIWNQTIQAFLERPFFGYGLNSFKYVITPEYSATHNNILEILLYMGLVGFLSFSYMLYLLAKEIYNTKNSIYLSFFAFFLVISQFDNSVTSSKIFLSILTIFAFFIFANRKPLLLEKEA